MLKRETVTNVRVDKHDSGQIAHDLMHFDQNLPGLLRIEGNRLDVWIDLAPLLRPVGSDLFSPTDNAPFEGPRPSYSGSHEGKSGIHVTRVEGRVCCA